MTYEEIMAVTGDIHTSMTVSMFNIRSLTGMCVQMMGEFHVDQFAFGVNLGEDMEERVGYTNYVEIELANIESIGIDRLHGNSYKTITIVVK